jgi:hypothetical protein
LPVCTDQALMMPMKPWRADEDVQPADDIVM